MALLATWAGLLSLTSTSNPMMREHEMSKLRHFSSPSRGMLSALLHLERKSEASLATSGRYDSIASFENPCKGQPLCHPLSELSCSDVHHGRAWCCNDERERRQMIDRGSSLATADHWCEANHGRSGTGHTRPNVSVGVLRAGHLCEDTAGSLMHLPLLVHESIRTQQVQNPLAPVCMPNTRDLKGRADLSLTQLGASSEAHTDFNVVIVRGQKGLQHWLCCSELCAPFLCCDMDQATASFKDLCAC